MQKQQQTHSSTLTRNQKIWVVILFIGVVIGIGGGIVARLSTMPTNDSGEMEETPGGPVVEAEQADTDNDSPEPATTEARNTSTDTAEPEKQTTETAGPGPDRCETALNAVTDNVGQLADALLTGPDETRETFETIDNANQQAANHCTQQQIDDHETNLQKRSERCETAIEPVNTAIQQAADAIDAATSRASDIADTHRTGTAEQQAAAAHNAVHLIETIQNAWFAAQATTGNGPDEHASRLLGQCNSYETAVHTYITAQRIRDMQAQAQQTTIVLAEIAQPHQH